MTATITGRVVIDLRTADDERTARHLLGPLSAAPVGADVELIVSPGQGAFLAADLAQYRQLSSITVVSSCPATVARWVAGLREPAALWEVA